MSHSLWVCSSENINLARGLKKQERKKSSQSFSNKDDKLHLTKLLLGPQTSQNDAKIADLGPGKEAPGGSSASQNKPGGKGEAAA